MSAGLWRVDAKEPDTLAVYLDRVSIDHPGSAGN